jgi:hypothetical protein
MSGFLPGDTQPNSQVTWFETQVETRKRPFRGHPKNMAEHLIFLSEAAALVPMCQK